MLKEPSILRKGLFFAAAWAAWLFGGIVYAMSQGSIFSFLITLPPDLRVIFYLWVLVLSALFGQAVFNIFLGTTGRSPPRP
jgi:hypothetical protein